MAGENTGYLDIGALHEDGGAANTGKLDIGAVQYQAAAAANYMLMMLAANKRGNKLTHRGRKQ